MPRLPVATRKRVIILRHKGYSLRDIQCRLKEEDVEVTIRSLQRLCVKFEKMHTIKDISRAPKRRLLTPEMLSAMDNCLRNDDQLTASKLKTKLLERCTNLPDVSLSTIKRLENQCISVCMLLILWY